MSIEDDVYGIDAADPFSDDAAPASVGWSPRRWWTWTLALLAIGTLLLVIAGRTLSEATLGTSLAARSCSASPIGGLLLLLAASTSLAAGIIISRLRRLGSVLAVDPGSLVLSLPLPATLLAATLPGVLGCRIASDLAELDLVGPALAGQGGLLLCAASTALVGMSLASTLHVTWLAPAVAASAPEPGLVELAVLEAEALEQDAAATRFRGVDPEP